MRGHTYQKTDTEEKNSTISQSMGAENYEFTKSEEMTAV